METRCEWRNEKQLLTLPFFDIGQSGHKRLAFGDISKLSISLPTQQGEDCRKQAIECKNSPDPWLPLIPHRYRCGARASVKSVSTGMAYSLAA